VSSPSLKPNREAIWFEAAQQPFADFGHELPDGLLLGNRKLVDCGDVFPRRDNHMAVNDGLRVRERNRMLRLDPDAIGVRRGFHTSNRRSVETVFLWPDRSCRDAAKCQAAKRGIFVNAV